MCGGGGYCSTRVVDTFSLTRDGVVVVDALLTAVVVGGWWWWLLFDAWHLGGGGGVIVVVKVVVLVVVRRVRRLRVKRWSINSPDRPCDRPVNRQNGDGNVAGDFFLTRPCPVVPRTRDPSQGVIPVSITNERDKNVICSTNLNSHYRMDYMDNSRLWLYNKEIRLDDRPLLLTQWTDLIHEIIDLYNH